MLKLSLFSMWTDRQLSIVSGPSPAASSACTLYTHIYKIYENITLFCLFVFDDFRCLIAVYYVTETTGSLTVVTVTLNLC